MYNDYLGHFALIKFQEQEEKVPEGSNRYWWKRIAPPLEFGSMHAILFQMGLIPLTMSRLSISAASSTVLNRFIPFNRMLRFHIHLGYTMVLIVFLATIFFFAFFGLLCSDGDASFCAKMTSEIMITGYCILAFLLVIGGSAFYRDRMPYEIFYALHHLVFIVYAIATAHTLDVAQRTQEKDRSQTFKWYSATLLYYLCDRAAMHMNHRYFTSIAASSAVSSSEGSRMAIIKLYRPTLFHFRPGQYCMLRIPAIDTHWHPFSIASGPDSDYLEFYIEVHAGTSWTNKLWGMIDNHGDQSLPKKQKFGYCKLSSETIVVEVRGPYGTEIHSGINEFSHVLAVGSGTGIVPMLSLLKHHIHQLRCLHPESYFQEQKLCDRKTQHLLDLNGMGNGKRHFDGPNSYANYTTNVCKGMNALMGKTQSRLSLSIGAMAQMDMSEKEQKTSLAHIRRESRKVKLGIYGGVMNLLPPVFGVSMIGLTLSWNTIPIELYDGMDKVLQVGTIVFQSLFALVAVAAHYQSPRFLAYTDAVIFVISAFVDWYWFVKGLWANFGPGDLTNYVLLLSYMIIRMWYDAVESKNKSWRKEVSRSGFLTLDKVTFIWVTRSASLVSKIVPDIIGLWDGLSKAWGEEAARKVCDISIFITDKDDDACTSLLKEVKGSSINELGAIKFQRPDLQDIIENHTIDRINDKRGVHSSTLLAFCGSPKLSAHIHHAKIANDISTVISGNSLHQMDFVSESYGSSKKSRETSIYPKPKQDITPKRVNTIYNDGVDRFDVEKHTEVLFSQECGSSFEIVSSYNGPFY